MKGEQGYLDLLKEIMDHGIDKDTRNGKTRSLFAKQLRFDLMDGFPALTTKKLAFKAVKSELLWFLEMGIIGGRANDNRLKELNGSERTIWTDNAEAPYWKDKAMFDGDLGRVYGMQWRQWRKKPHVFWKKIQEDHVDQIAELIDKLKNNPNDRRMIVTAWNPGELDEMALPPCHMMFQCYVANNKLSLHMLQRSCDMFLGVPFNIASYALLMCMLRKVTGLELGELIITLNDAHIYHDHFDAVKEQLTREPLELPSLGLVHRHPDKGIDGFHVDDIQLLGYKSHPPIKAKMAV